MKQELVFKTSAALLLSSILIFPADARAQQFTKVTTGPVVSTPGDSRSVNWIDVNNDGWVDLMITNGPSAGQKNHLFLNDGAGGFTQVINDPVVQDVEPFDGASWADTDNDGDMDCMVVTWYGFNNYFYTNNGTGTFSKVTTGSLVTTGTFSETCSWGDYDNDGLVDLYVCNSDGVLNNLLYHNEGNNVFFPVTTGDMVTDEFSSRSVNWTDIDNDGDLDLFVTNEYGDNELMYRNDGAGVFTKWTTGDLLNDGGNTMSSSWADYDNDGDLDVFLANDQGSNALFRNEGGFNFTKIIADTVSKSNSRSFSSAWSDIDNDGDLDLFVTNSFKQGSLLLNFLYTNNGDGTFSRVDNTVPATDMGWSYGCAFGDYDNDGFEDLAVATCRFGSSDRNDLLYHNTGNSNNWITVKLSGTTSNKAAIGAKIKVKAVINGVPVWQLREISAQSSYCGQNDMRAHFGLRDAGNIDSLVVSWPSGLRETFTNVTARQFLPIVEGQGVSGVKKQTLDIDLFLFPNPTNGTLALRSKQAFSQGDKISIADTKGQQLAAFILKKDTHVYEIDLSRILPVSDGNYFITLTTKEGVVTRKVIKL